MRRLRDDDDVRNEAWFNHLSARLGSTQLTHASAAIDQLEAAKKCLGQILQDLPTKHDWLDPELERQAKVLLQERE